MSPLPRRALFAVAAVVDIALHGRPAPVASRALADRHGLRPRHLETALQALVRAGILRSVRGPRGGYELARERRRITVGDIVRACQSNGSGRENADGPELVAAVIDPALADAGARYLEALDGITVEGLCEAAGDRGQDSEVNFTI